jgi:hypothetical protein
MKVNPILGKQKVYASMATLKKHQILTIGLVMMTGTAIAYNDVMSTHLSFDPQASKKDTLKGHIGGMSNQINRDVGDVPGNRYNGDLRFSYSENAPDELERKFDLSAMVNDQSLTMYSLQEAYVGIKGVLSDPLNENSTFGDKLKIGRHILPWSTVDAHWGLGKLNNRRNFDFFDPGQEGLMGIGHEIRMHKGFFVRSFLSGVYVPEMNPGLDINKKDKTITSRNAWADAPASTTNVEGNDTPIEYNVDYPEISDVIYRYSAGVNLGWENKNWVVDGYFIRKPENQITTNVEVALAESSETVKAFITPEFYYHDLYGGNLKYRNADMEIYISGIAVRPNTFPDGNREATLYTEIKTEKRREDYVGGGISRSNDKFAMGANYVARLSPFDRVRDSLAQDPRWNQALNGFVMRNFGSSLRLSADVKYDMLTTDRLVMLRAGYKVSKQLLMTFGVNMIGTPESGKSYWSPYTNNDAVFGGMRYVF